MRQVATPDKRYFVPKGRLWRCTNLSLQEPERTRLVKELMKARRDVKAAMSAKDDNALALARQNVNLAKIALGERGSKWWGDDPDYNRQLIENTPYAAWWSEQRSNGLNR